MRVPTDKPLGVWIRELIACNKLYRFYKTDDWLEIKEEVMEDYNYECQRHKRRGEYARAQTVHHVREVKKFPDLALTRYAYDAEGNKIDTFEPLCNQCHNDTHGRTFKGSKPKPQLNEERWD